MTLMCVPPAAHARPRELLADDDQAQRGRRHLRLVLALLTSGAFFVGYDGAIIGLLLPQVHHSFRLGPSTLGTVRLSALAGSLVGFVLACSLHRVGHWAVLVWSALGCMSFTVLSAASWNVQSLMTFQFATGMFIGFELTASITVMRDDCPLGRSRRPLCTLVPAAALGAATVMVGLAIGLGANRLDRWTSCLVAGVPIMLVAVLVGLPEGVSVAWLHSRRSHGAGPIWLKAPVPRGRNRTLAAIGLVHALRRIPQSAAITWWVFYTERERGFSPERIALFVILSYGICTLGSVACSRCMGRYGRRPTALAGLAAGLACTVVFFQAVKPTVSFIAMLGAMFFSLGLTPVTSAVATELLPAEAGPAAACIRNVFDIVGTVLAPLAVGALGDHSGGPIGNLGNAIALLAMLWLPVAYLVCRHLPETPECAPMTIEERPFGDREFPLSSQGW